MKDEAFDRFERPKIQGLNQLIRASEAAGAAPVERWDPPYCGNIGLAIGRDGTWFYQGSPIRRMELVRLFARVLRRDDDGRYFLVTPGEKVDIAVEDSPFLAVEMEMQGEGESQSLMFRTNVDDIVVCGPERPLRFVTEPGSGGVKPYVLVRGRLEALVARAVTYDLLQLVEENDSGEAGLWSGGVFFSVA